MGHFQKCYNFHCFPSKILHKHCKNNACAKFWRTNKEYYGIFESGLLLEQTGSDFFLDLPCFQLKTVEEVF